MKCVVKKKKPLILGLGWIYVYRSNKLLFSVFPKNNVLSVVSFLSFCDFHFYDLTLSFLSIIFSFESSQSQFSAQQIVMVKLVIYVNSDLVFNFVQTALVLLVSKNSVVPPDYCLLCGRVENYSPQLTSGVSNHRF